MASDGSDALEIVDVTDPVNWFIQEFCINGRNAAPHLIYPFNVVVSGNYDVKTIIVNALKIVDEKWDRSGLLNKEHRDGFYFFT